MKRILISTVMALSLATLAGCSAAGSLSEDSMGSDSAPSAPLTRDGSGSLESGGGSVAFESGEKVITGPRIITTVQVTVTVDTPIESADEASRITSSFGGTVANRSEQRETTDTPGSAQLTLRIPSAKLTAALEKLKELGVPRNTMINSTDVTAESQDLDARIAALQTSVDRLLGLLEKATSTDNLLAIETALSDRQANLESLQSQKRYLDDQVQLSTVNLYLVSERDTPAETPDTFWSGLAAGWDAFVGFWSLALVALGVMAPWLLTMGIATVLVLFWVRLARRRSTNKTAD